MDERKDESELSLSLSLAPKITMDSASHHHHHHSNHQKAKLSDANSKLYDKEAVRMRLGPRPMPPTECIDNEERVPLSSHDDDGGVEAASAKKKLRLSKEQVAVLGDIFKKHSNLNQKQKVALAKQLKLRPRQVELWFQNRRARAKLKQTEVECEWLRRRCENLAEENKRLKEEAQELRALKVSPSRLAGPMPFFKSSISMH